MNILILEDDPTMREVLIDALEDFEEYQVHGAPLPSDALELARRIKFDLVVSDVRMDQMDGIQCLAQLRQLQPGLRSIVITGYASEDAPARAIGVEAEDYLYKPFTLQAFQEAVQRLLQRHKRPSLYARLVGAIKSALAQAEVAGLERARDMALKGYFVAIRSKMLDEGTALDMWDLLEDLEKERDNEAARRAVADGYRTLAQKLARGETRQGRPPMRPAGRLPKNEFSAFFGRIQKGELGLEHVEVAPVLRVMSYKAREESPEASQLHREIWPSESDPRDFGLEAQRKFWEDAPG